MTENRHRARQHARRIDLPMEFRLAPITAVKEDARTEWARMTGGESSSIPSDLALS